MTATRLIAWLGSAIGNASLFGAIIAGWPGLPPWNYGFPEPHGGAVLELGFHPFVDPVFANGPASRRGPDCPDPSMREQTVALDYAPLPLAFDPSAYSDRLMFACVRVDGAGAISGVALIGVEDPGTARALTRTIRNEWRFSPAYPAQSEGGWVRVRLNASSFSTNVDYFYPL
jgi:hypothetical protein